MTDDNPDAIVTTCGGPLARVPPHQMIAHHREIAEAVIGLVEECGLAVDIRGSKHLRVEAWLWLARMTGHSVWQTEPEPSSNEARAPTIGWNPPPETPLEWVTDPSIGDGGDQRVARSGDDRIGQVRSDPYLVA